MEEYLATHLKGLTLLWYHSQTNIFSDHTCNNFKQNTSKSNQQYIKNTLHCDHMGFNFKIQGYLTYENPIIYHTKNIKVNNYMITSVEAENQFDRIHDLKTYQKTKDRR